MEKTAALALGKSALMKIAGRRKGLVSDEALKKLARLHATVARCLDSSPDAGSK